MAFDVEQLGVWSDEVEFKVEADRLRAYAEATNDPIGEHRSGDLAPPVFAVVPVWPVIATGVAKVVAPEMLNLVVHGEQDMDFHQPIRPGMVLRSRAAPVGVHVKKTGTVITTRLETRDAAGDLVNRQHMTTFVRSLTEGDSVGEPAPNHRFPGELRGTDPLAEVSQHLDEDQTFRYAEASGDRMPIHLDDEIARSVGLPGIIIHGLCTMAFTSHAVVQAVAGGDSTRLKRLAVRFSLPVLPGQDISTRIWEQGERDGRRIHPFQTANPEGDAVIKDGLAEVE